MATSKFRPFEVPDQVAPAVREYLDDTLNQMAVLLDGAADYLNDDLILRAANNETITGAWDFDGAVTLNNGLTVNDTEAALMRTVFENLQGGVEQNDIRIKNSTRSIFVGVNYGGAANAFIDNRTGTNLLIKQDGTDLASFRSSGMQFFYNVKIDPNTVGPMLDIGDGAGANNDSLLRLNTDRPWSFRQYSTGAGTALLLYPENNNKTFMIGANNGNLPFRFYCGDTSPYFYMYDGGQFRILDSTNTHYIYTQFSGTTCTLGSTGSVTMVMSPNSLGLTPATLNINPTGNANINPGGNFQLLSGNAYRVFESTNTAYADLRVSALSGNGYTTRLQHNTGGQFTIQEQQNLADDATATFAVSDVQHRGIAAIVTNYDTSAMCMFFYSGTLVSSIAAGSNISLGTGSNPDVDTDLNVWVNSSGTISVKNRLGSSRHVTLYRWTTD